jgi:hypothetical protein
LVLRIEGLDKTYHSVDSALSGVSLSVGDSISEANVPGNHRVFELGESPSSA